MSKKNPINPMAAINSLNGERFRVFSFDGMGPGGPEGYEIRGQVQQNDIPADFDARTRQHIEVDFAWLDYADPQEGKDRVTWLAEGSDQIDEDRSFVLQRLVHREKYGFRARLR